MKWLLPCVTFLFSPKMATVIVRYIIIGQFHVWCSSGHGVSGHGCTGDSPDFSSSTNVSVLQTFSHFVVCCLYVYTLKTATEQTVIDCFSWMSIRSNYISSALFHTFCMFHLTQNISSLASPRSMPFNPLAPKFIIRADPPPNAGL